jgi:hypothetical protein
MATTLEIIQGLQQAAANSYDGAHDARYTSDGEEHKAGLKREEGDAVLESRAIDGFKITISGDKLRVLYQYEGMIKEVHDSEFESEIKRQVASVVRYLKSEYKKITGDGITLSKDGEVDILVEYISRIRTSVRATQTFKIGGMKGVDQQGTRRALDVDSAVENWLAIGKDKYPGTKKPQNVTRKKS